MTGILEHFEFVLGSTPLERWDALTKSSSGSGVSPWIITAGLALIIMLLLLLSIGYVRRKQNNPASSRRRFDEYARLKELTDRQYRLLTKLATGAGLRHEESIFSLPTVFDREVKKMIENAKTQAQGEQLPALEAEMTALREKLDFRQYTPLADVASAAADMHSTTEIPLKKKIYIKRNHRAANGDLQAIIIDNTPAGLLVEFPAPAEVIFGQTWICRYHTGPFVAEFMTTPIRCSGHKVLLHHSHRARLINRRKVLRVPTQKPALVTVFPFKNEQAAGQNENRFSRNQYGLEPPQFRPATITELGGPGLRIRTDLKLQPNDRVLVMFKLKKDARSNTHDSRNNTPEYSIEHIAKVRHIIHDTNGPSAALELIGLNDNEIDELIRITNETAISSRKKRTNVRLAAVDGNSTRQFAKV